ncbi:hypothetical protein Peur_058062 [Populus x canadensis]
MILFFFLGKTAFKPSNYCEISCLIPIYKKCFNCTTGCFPLIRILLSFYFCAHHISCTLPKKSLHHKQSDRRRETQKIQIQLSRKNSFGALTEANPTERKRQPW